jgi:hypothetical protein
MVSLLCTGTTQATCFTILIMEGNAYAGLRNV